MSDRGHQLLFPSLPYDMSPRADRASADVQLQQLVSRATILKDHSRRDACANTFGERYEAMRELAAQIKQHTLDYLDYYLEKFVDNAVAAGSQVHFASKADQANEICLDIARANGCRLCVKSKSMVTEEIQLVPALEGIGIETIETDLGEFILQLDHDAPSHIVMPMIHKDRTAVARAFTRELGAPYTEDPKQLAKIAREYLRNKYRHADLGISGGNFLVAETGSVVLCTNEGNWRLCTSVPRVHVAFVGIEKLVARLAHLAVMLKLLARSSTGQDLTVYTHIMTGPKRSHEKDGPEQMHIILVDNGRTDILRKETRELLRCIRCGACLNACPVYRKIGGHSYGAVYSGPIGAVITPLLKGLSNFKDLPHASSLCGACYEACPVKINIPKYLIQLRANMVTSNISKWSERLVYQLWAFSLRYGASYRLGALLQRILFRCQARWDGALDDSHNPYSTRGWLRDVRGPAKGWTQERDLPTPTAKSFRHWWRRRQHP